MSLIPQPRFGGPQLGKPAADRRLFTIDVSRITSIEVFTDETGDEPYLIVHGDFDDSVTLRSVGLASRLGVHQLADLAHPDSITAA